MGVLVAGGIRLLLAAALALMFSAGWTAAWAAEDAQRSVAAPKPVAATSRPARIATSVLANRPLIQGPLLSPDGKRVAGRVTAGGTEVLGIIDFSAPNPQLIKMGESWDLRWYRWAGNGAVLFSVGMMVPYFDSEAYQTRLLVYDLATGATRFIGGRSEGLIGDDLLWIDPAGKDLLLSYQKTIYDWPSVFRIDIATNQQQVVVRPYDNIWDWYADDQGVVRFGFGNYGYNRWQMVYRATEGEKFRPVVRARVTDDIAGYDAVRVIQGSDEGYMLDREEANGRYALFKFNFATRQRGELMFESPTNDIDSFDTAPDGKALLAAWYTDDRPRVHWFDPVMKSLQDDFDSAVGTRQASIVSRSRDEKIMLVHVGASNDPGAYYVFQKADGALRRFASVNEALSPRQLASTRYVHYQARDGLEIPAYLTLPLGRAARGLPLIILPHGGPYDIRDDGSYDAEVQFYANRGYAVLQPQFRGSGGYGKPFYEKGEGQWGRAMQDDLDDGMDWLAKDGVIDPKRVCIIGSSYGGFAALWGAARNPERYRCAATFAGISDLGRQLKYQLDFKISKRYRRDWRTTVKGADDFDLKTVSPLYTIAQLHVPILLMHGDKDQRVPYVQSSKFAEALRGAGKAYEFYSLAGEGHGFSTRENMQQWFDRLDVFLAKYNPAD